MGNELFKMDNGPDPYCKKCDGKGHYMYDHNHGTICDACCPHDQGRWLLTEDYSGYRKGVETWCCRRGCGKTFDTEFD